MSINNADDRGNWEFVPKAPIEVEPFDMYSTVGDYGSAGVVDWERQFEEEKRAHDSHRMGQLRATSIAGNDITCKIPFKKLLKFNKNPKNQNFQRLVYILLV